MSAFFESSQIVGDCYLHSLVPRHHPPDAHILLIPGSGHGWWAWRDWTPALAACGFGAHALSFPNHTDAPALPEREYCALTVHDYVARVQRIAEGLSGPVVLVGHSLGGVVAQVAAGDMELAALILVASAGPRQLGRTRLHDFPADRPVVFDPDTARARWFADAEPEVVDWAIAQVSPESPGVLNGSGGRAEVDPARITCPVLVVKAGRDASSVPPGERLAALYGATLLEVPEAGHDLMLERSALRTVRRVIAWLDSLR